MTTPATTPVTEKLIELCTWKPRPLSAGVVTILSILGGNDALAAAFGCDFTFAGADYFSFDVKARKKPAKSIRAVNIAITGETYRVTFTKPGKRVWADEPGPEVNVAVVENVSTADLKRCLTRVTGIAF